MEPSHSISPADIKSAAYEIIKGKNSEKLKNLSTEDRWKLKDIILNTSEVNLSPTELESIYNKLKKEPSQKESSMRRSIQKLFGNVLGALYGKKTEVLGIKSRISTENMKQIIDNQLIKEESIKTIVDILAKKYNIDKESISYEVDQKTGIYSFYNNKTNEPLQDLDRIGNFELISEFHIGKHY
jgi:hypothetical protein